MPQAERGARLRQRRRRRAQLMLQSKPVWIGLMLALYLLFCASLILLGVTDLALTALLPLLLAPAVAGLAWWITWLEFHR